jgi:hypothetical protein
MNAVRLYRERDPEGLFRFPLDAVAYSNLLGLVSVYRRDAGDLFQLQQLDGEGLKVNHVWADEAARALSGAIADAMPDVTVGREEGGEHALRDRLFRYWKTRLSLLDQVAAYAGRGGFTAYIDV